MEWIRHRCCTFMTSRDAYGPTRSYCRLISIMHDDSLWREEVRRTILNFLWRVNNSQKETETLTDYSTPLCPTCMGRVLTVELTNKIDIFLRKAVKWGYAQKVTSLSELLRNDDEKLFSKMRSSNHSIHQLFPPAKTLPMKLRSTHCVFALPQCNCNLYKSSFVLRNLFLDAYWNILF